MGRATDLSSVCRRFESCSNRGLNNRSSPSGKPAAVSRAGPCARRNRPPASHATRRGPARCPPTRRATRGAAGKPPARRPPGRQASGRPAVASAGGLGKRLFSVFSFEFGSYRVLRTLSEVPICRSLSLSKGAANWHAARQNRALPFDKLRAPRQSFSDRFCRVACRVLETP